MRKTNWDIVNAIQRSAKVTSDDTWETLLEVDPLYISDKDLVEQIAEKRRQLTWYEMFRKWLGTPTNMDDKDWYAFRDDSIENNRLQLKKMQKEYQSKIKEA
jgi:hypothetical protein|tara:strand:+ start:1534 stop:1839 length:306 start_codon:yes stop_codon:yes gene_type:complete